MQGKKNNKFNIYDFDKTIYKKDSTIEFYKYCLRNNKKIIKYLPYQIINYFLFIFFRNDKYKSNFFIFLKSVDNIDKLVDEFWKNEKNNFRYDILNKNFIVVSASPLFLIKKVCLKLGAKDVIATNVNKNNGKFLSKNCHGIVKIDMLFEKYEDIDINEFYSDSFSDDYLARKSKKAFLISNDCVCDWDYDKKSYDSGEIIRYLFFGFLTFLIGIVSYYFLTIFLNPNKWLQLQIANILSWIIAVLFAYFTNALYVFDHKKNVNEFYKFILSRVITLIIDMLLMFCLVSICNYNDFISKIVVQLIVIVLNYIFSKLFIFKKDVKK